MKIKTSNTQSTDIPQKNLPAASNRSLVEIIIILIPKPWLSISLICAFAIVMIAGCTKKDITLPSAQSISATTVEDATARGPIVNFTFPKNGDTIAGTITIRVKATDSVAITSVQLKVDGDSIGAKTTSPYNFAWNTASVLNGSHILQAKAVDALGRSTIKKITVYTLNLGIVSTEQQLIDLINAERAYRELSPLTLNSKLQNGARFHSDDMAKNSFFSHTGSAGDALSNRLTMYGYVWYQAAENIAAGQKTAQEVFDAMMANTGQKSNIIYSAYKDIGIGAAYNGKANSYYHSYWTVVFGTTTP